MARFSGSRLLTLLRSKEDARILYSYPGASAAFSLRALAVGDPTVVRVRRSSDNAEANFTAREVNDGTLVAWVGNTASDDGHVVTWFDQSGNGNDATQATAANQPLIVDGGVLVTENEKPAIDCGVQADDLYVELTYTNFDFTSVSAIVVGSTNGFSGSGSTILGLNTNPRFYLPITTGSGLWFSYDDLEAIQLSNSATNSQFIVFTFSNASATEAFFNSVSSGSVASVSGSSAYIALGYNGGTAYHNGKMQEVVIYPSDQSANRSAIEQNIANYYGITLA